jgi:pimeloyl-ACP methyl ester carboxylesterase
VSTGPISAVSRKVLIETDSVALEGAFELPRAPCGLVIFAHGSGSGRHSPRNQHVARTLRAQHLGTLLFDLLTAEEERHDRATAALRFDIPLLARRLLGAVDWCRSDPDSRGLPLGLFGASTGAAAALCVAGERTDIVRAVVSRGGRPDLAGPSLGRVRAPTLFIVGARDYTVLALNIDAAKLIRSQTELSVVPDASHLFEEPGALDAVATLASAWFVKYLTASP